MANEDVVLGTKARVGMVVTYTYERTSRSDEPVRVAVVRVRPDLLWPDVLLNYVKDINGTFSSFLCLLVPCVD